VRLFAHAFDANDQRAESSSEAHRAYDGAIVLGPLAHGCHSDGFLFL